MNLDAEMLQIAKLFFEESREGLDTMEAGLLTLEASTDAENINTIFRAAHSMKGGAATFGFLEISTFTHGVETLLDEMRNGSRPITPGSVQTLLRACDCLRAIVAATETEQPVDRLSIDALNVEIAALLGSPVVHTRSASAASLPSAGSAAMVIEQASSEAPLDQPSADDWSIRFEPIAELLKVRNEPTRMFAELEKLGGYAVKADLSALPTVDQFDPELCYLAWDLQVRGDVAEQAIDEVFEWVDPGCIVDKKPGRGLLAAAQATAAGATIVPVPGSAAPTPAIRTKPPARSGATKAPSDSGSIRVATEKLDDIINLVGELVITQSMLGRFAEGADPSELDSLRQGLLQLARNTRELQESVMQVRMLPISFAFNRIPRMVHDLMLKLGKKVELTVSGEGTELDKTVLEKINDPLVHLVRNALDHGLETPERRLAAGKSDTGTLELDAFHQGGNIIIEVRDDGAGLNREKILNKARERGLVGSDQNLSDEQVQNLIFLPGFSTADQVSDVSGRGVGMDVVRRNINDLGGHVQISSREGKGSVIRIRLPLTLAILDGQLVRVGRETYVISLLSIVETIQVSRGQLSQVAGRAELFRLREEYLPVVKLCDLFGVEPDHRDTADGLLVVVEADGTRVGLLVDDLLAQQQVVIKSLEKNFKQVPGLAGATILGDGKIALILDIPGVILVAGKTYGEDSALRVA